MGENSGRSGRIVACGLAAALGLAAGVVIGLAIGSLKSESRQAVEAERDWLAQDAASLAADNADLRKRMALAKTYLDEWIRDRDAADRVKMTLGSTLTLISIFKAFEDVSDRDDSAPMTVTFLLTSLSAHLEGDTKFFRQHEAIAKPLVNTWMASAEKVSLREGFGSDLWVRWQNHFDKNVFGSPRLTTGKPK